MAEYGRREYWDTRYAQTPTPYDWLLNYTALRPIFHRYVTPSDKVLNVGCGNSLLPQEMAEDGFAGVTCVDLCRVVIQQCLEREGLGGSSNTGGGGGGGGLDARKVAILQPSPSDAAKIAMAKTLQVPSANPSHSTSPKPGSAGNTTPKSNLMSSKTTFAKSPNLRKTNSDNDDKNQQDINALNQQALQQSQLKKKRQVISYAVMDCRNLEYEDESFDVIIDKSLLDSLLCFENCEESISNYLSNVARVLKPNGRFINISTSGVLRKALLENQDYSWIVEVFNIPKPKVSEDYIKKKKSDEEGKEKKSDFEDEENCVFIFVCRLGGEDYEG